MLNKWLVLLFFCNFFLAQSQVHSIDKDDFQNNSFPSLSFLNEELNNVRIVALGESGHIMGATYVAKIKMVKFLHEELGFDVIAFEAPMYNLSKLYDFIQRNDIDAREIGRQNSGVWNTKEMLELYDYVLETQKTKNPLIYTGFDESIFSASEYDDFTKDYITYLQKLSKETEERIIVDSVFKNAINNVVDRAYSFKKIPERDTLLLFSRLSEIREIYKRNIPFQEDTYFKFWDRMSDNIQSLYRKNYQKSNRDEKMAKNVSFLANEIYSDKKMILWGANYHFINQPNSIEYLEKQKSSKRSMGYFLKKEFGGKYYSIAFTAFTGKTGFKGYLGLGKKRVKTKKGSLERYINEVCDCEFAYFSMKNEESKKMIIKNKLNQSNILALKPYKMDLTKPVDAYFYIKEEFLSSYGTKW